MRCTRGCNIGEPTETSRRTESYCEADRPDVVAVVVTFNRPAVLLKTLAGVTTQTVRPRLVVVVDNACDSAQKERIERIFPHVIYLLSPENIGFGAGLTVGMKQAAERHDPGWYWLLDDDSPPLPNDLANALAAAAAFGPVGLVANRGGRIRWGRVRHDLTRVTVATPADFSLIDGSLVSREAVLRCGYPREDFFMGFEDIEYSTRLASAGLRVLVRPAEVQALHLGASSAWRRYYQSRNHLRVAIERRSIRWAVGYLWRLLALTVVDIRRGRWRTLTYGWQGAADGIRGRMGRTIEP